MEGETAFCLGIAYFSAGELQKAMLVSLNDTYSLLWL